MNEQKSIIKILKKTSHSFSEMRSVLLKIRNNSLSFADTVIEFGSSLFRKHRSSLQDEQFVLLEELFNAAIDLHLYHIADKCLKKLWTNFSDSPKISVMKALLLEAVGKQDILQTQLYDNLAKNLADYDSKKRVIAQTRYSEGNQSTQFLDKMNQYLEDNPNDGEAWLELGDYYLEHLNFSKALFCYEELIILYPKKYMYMARVAEINYTIGGEAELLNARSYYSFVLNKMSNNYRCIWGLIQTCKKLLSINKDDDISKNLLETSILALKSFYKEKGQSHLLESLDL